MNHNELSPETCNYFEAGGWSAFGVEAVCQERAISVLPDGRVFYLQAPQPWVFETFITDEDFFTASADGTS